MPTIIKPVLVFGVVVALTAWATSTTAEAQTRNCAPREIVVKRLGSKYGEKRQSIGLNNSQTVMEVFASLETGTWTILVTSTDGITCLVASGQAFEAVAEVLPTVDPL